MDRSGVVIFTVFLLIILVLFGGPYYIRYSSIKNFEGNVEKTIIQNGETYFIIKNISENKSEVFENNDVFLFGKMDSADFLMNIEAGKTYTFKVMGWRIPLFSMYRNILDYQEVN